MSLNEVLFTGIAFGTGFSALGVVLTRNIVRAAIWLLFTLIGVSLIYFFLGAEFLGAGQLIVYVGGTMVLVVFGVMLTAQGPFLKLVTDRKEWLVGGGCVALLFGLLVAVFLQLGETVPPIGESAALSVGELGLTFSNATQVSPDAALSGFPPNVTAPKRTANAYLLPFEILSVHLLVVLIGAAYLARAKRRRPTPAKTEVRT